MSEVVQRGGDVCLDALVGAIAHDPAVDPFPVVDMDHTASTSGHLAAVLPRLDAAALTAALRRACGQDPTCEDPDRYPMDLAPSRDSRRMSA